MSAMFARLCTVIRWLGTAMFVAVLILWGVAAMRPRQTTFDLSFLHHATIHQFDLIAGGKGFAFASFRSVGPDHTYFAESAFDNISDRGPRPPIDATMFRVLESWEPLDMWAFYARTYKGSDAPARYANAWAFRGHWWHPLALPFAARTTQLIIRRRRTRANPTACKSCGYDLRAGHDKCPECGGESHVRLPERSGVL